MKADNLKILYKNGFNVPPFITVTDTKNIDLSFSRAELFAVRSSFGGEDGEKHSFAGQYKTLLNVKRADVPAAVSKVFKSLDSAAVYASAKGIKNENGCVIIQEMIDASLSGVVFTADPRGVLNEAVVTVGRGTGDNVVNDSGETQTYFFNRSDKLWYSGGQGDLASGDTLTALLQTADRIQALFGTYIDMEFCIRDDIVYILQARPVTSIHPKRIIMLDSSNISESYPGITLPLTQSFVNEVYYRIFEGCLKRLSNDKKLVKKMRPFLKNMTACANGREYYVISNWYAFLSLLPFSKKITGIWQEMLGVEENDFYAPKIKTNVFQRAKILFSFIYYLCTTPKHMKKLNGDFAKNYPFYRLKAAQAGDIYELLAVYEDIKTEILSVWDITLVNDMYAFIFTHLSGRGKKLDDITPESMQPVFALDGVIKAYKAYGAKSGEYTALKNRYIDLYGDRISGELKLETPTYRTDPALLDVYAATHEPSGIKQPRKKIFIAPFTRRAVKGIANRETSRLNRSRIFGLIRTIMLDIGEILVKNRLLDEKEDVFYLYARELENALHLDPKALKALIADRKRLYAGLGSVPYFRRLIFADKIVEKTGIYTVSASNSRVLYGVGTSGGKVTGEVLVVSDPTNVNAEGKIIVTQSTDPGWIFLIQGCRGMIAERGSLLSHTAIISRELKKPAVVNVKNASRILKTGMNVELDADRGRIRIL
ncbi:MAG: hypothetical protein IKS17_10810 [Firmicutes bacterium]|nr:hypothetical protein [Bacillota bacterium]